MYLEIAFPGKRGAKAAVWPCPTIPRITASQIQVPLWKFWRHFLPPFLRPCYDGHLMVFLAVPNALAPEIGACQKKFNKFLIDKAFFLAALSSIQLLLRRRFSLFLLSAS